MTGQISKLPGSFSRTVYLVLATLPLALAGPKAAPLPVGPDGRAIYRVVKLVNADDLTYADLSELGFILERATGGAVVAWLSPEGMEKLNALGIPWREIPEAAHRARTTALKSSALAYHDHAALTTELRQIANDHPAITQLVSAGDSVDGRALWWLKISDNPNSEEDEPSAKYISTMHGDEAVGTEMCLQLIHWLTDNYGSDPRATRLVNETEFWIMPMMNPDGNARSQRFNAKGVDLNRNFPDWWDDHANTTQGRAAETAAIMNWQFDHATSLSINFHSGALVVNYPFDNNARGASVDSPTPDNDIVRELALEYSEDNAPMYGGAFPQGITNGADWYAISGGMQDWNYNWEGDIENTVELSNTKWPPADQLEGLWHDNQEAMISYLERVLTGVRGVVTDRSSGAPLAARLSIVGRDAHFFTDPEVGNYQRCLPAGHFEMLVESAGYESRTVPVVISDSEANATRVDVQLHARPTVLRYTSHRLTDDADTDGWLEAGESGHLAVTLRNDGAATSGIVGSLLALSSYGSASGSADWPDLGAGEQGETLPPYLAISAAANTPPGHKLAFATQWQSAEGPSGITEAFFVPVGVPDTSRQDATDLPRQVLDNSRIESPITVTSDREIREVNVFVSITHSYRGDLRVTLIAPDDRLLRLHDREGGGADNLRTWYDTETEPIDDLTTLGGSSSLGTWRLRVEDLASGSEGSLDAWTLEIISNPWENPIAAVLLRQVTRTAAGDVTLDWWPVGSASSYQVYRSPDPSSEAAFQEVTAADPDTTDTHFEDSAAGTFLSWIVSARGHSGEGFWGHFSH